MVRTLASVKVIRAIEPIPNADTLEAVRIEGWTVVAKKGTYTVGEKVIYFEPDAMLPMIPQFEFLKARGTRWIQDESTGERFEGYRIKVIKLRGQFSEGLIAPLSDFNLNQDIEVDTDLTDTIGVKKWEVAIPAQLRGKVKSCTRPYFVPMTDETRVQTLRNCIAKFAGTQCYISEKVDGSSISVYLKDGVFGVCTRNTELDTSDESSQFMKTVREMDVENKLRNLGKNVLLQGELFGPGIQKNRMNLVKHRIVWYNVMDLDTNKFLDYQDFVKFIENLGFTTVPILTTDYILDSDSDAILKMAEGKSVINPKSEREGIVIRPMVEMPNTGFSGLSYGGRLTFKAISQNYQVKNDE
jgi:RNA ligase (TIGR02306 family)